MKLPETTFAHAAGESKSYDALLSCSRCATCLPACPSYSATMLETRSPRGRLQLLRAVEEGTLTPSTRLRDALSTCLDCRACETACPNGLHPGQSSTRARAGLHGAMTFSRWVKRQLLGPLLAHQNVLDFGLAATGLLYQRTGIQHLLRRSGVLSALPAALARMDRYLPAIPARSVRRSLPTIVPAVGKRVGRVGFFLGCAMNTLFAEVTRHSIASLSLLGYEVVIPPGVVCCGAPQVSLGEFDIARRMARANVACFTDADIIVTDCAACGAELKHYHELLDDGEVRGFSSRVRDYSEFVAPLVPNVAVDIGPVTWHAPCHLHHAQGVCRPPRDLLRRLCPDYRDMREHDRCCGSAGMYWAQYPAISEDARARKLRNVRESGARTVVTANPGCILQILAGRTEEDDFEVMHIADVVHAALTR